MFERVRTRTSAILRGVVVALFFRKVGSGVDAWNRISTGGVWCCTRRILSGWTWVQSLAPFVCLVFAGLAWAQANVESFESLEGWTTHVSQNAHVELALDEGVVGKSLRVDFDIQPGGSFVIVRKPVQLKLPKNYVFKLWIRGQGAPNDLQFKLVDPSGRNVWWYRQRPCHFPADWRQLAIRDARVEFAWGDAPAAQPAEIGFIEFAIAAGTGGRGSLWLDELTWEPRKAVKGRMPRPRVEASTSVPGSEAEAVLDSDPGTAWRSGVLAAKQWLQIDFQAPQEYGAIVIDWDPMDYAVVYRVLASADGEHWWSLFASEHGNGGRDYIPTGEAESRWIRIEMEQSSRGQGYAIRSLTVKPYELAASPNVFFGTLASEAPPGLYPRYFVPEQVYWTAVAPPSGGRQALLGSDGAIEPVAGGYSVEPFVYRNGSLFSWKQVQSVPLSNEAMAPIPRVAWEHEWFRLEVETFASGTDTAHAFFARYELQNRLPEQAQFSLFLAVRPFQVLPPWQNLNLVGGVSSIRELAFDSRTIWIDRKPAIVVQSPGARFGAAYFEEGMVTESLARGSLPPRVQIADPLGYASGALEYKMTLSPGQKSAVYLAFPWDAAGVGELQLATDGAEVAYRQQLERARESWQRQLGRVEFELPAGASDIEATLRSAMAHILMNQRGAALQPGPRTYARAWIRDGVTMAAALLQLGAAAEPRAFVRWFAQYQLPDGRIPCCVDWRGADPVPEHDSNGEFLFLVAEYYRFTRDVGLVAELWPQIQAAVDWIDRARAQRMTDLYRTGDKRLFYGLLPESISHEGYAAHPVHSYWDDFWALRGLEDAARLEGLAYDKLVRQKNELVASLRKAKYLDVLAAYPTVELRNAEAKFGNGGALYIDGERTTFERMVIATGAQPWVPPIPGLDGVSYLTSTEALALTELPHRLAVLGGSAVGLELGQMFSRFGVEVTVLEVLPRILPQEDEAVSTALRQYLEAEGLTIHTSAQVQRVERVRNGVGLSVVREGTAWQIEADQVLVATGRRPNTTGLGLDLAGIVTGPRGEVQVDAFLQTSREGVYAAGDVLGDPMFVYVAAYTGTVAAENALLGNLRPVVLGTVPRVTFTDPAVASVGMTETRARELGEPVAVATLPLEHVPRALVSHDPRGLVKVVVSRDSRQLLGVHIVAAEAGEMIQEASMAMRFGIGVDELAAALHPYLTYSEAMKLACQSLEKDVAKLSCCAA